MTPETRAVLNRAADLVEQGWCQRMLQKVVDGRQCYCMVGAVSKADSENPDCDPVYDEALWAITRRLDGRELSIVAAWNDAPDRTQAEVVAVLRAVAMEGGEG